MANQRDDFTTPVRDALARRVAYRCSNPHCRQTTSGPAYDPEKAVNVGVAAHITAAAEGGPRYDNALTPQERSSVANGIWLCQNHAKMIDSDEVRFTVAVLRQWKHAAEQDADQQLRASEPGYAPVGFASSATGTPDHPEDPKSAAGPVVGTGRDDRRFVGIFYEAERCARTIVNDAERARALAEIAKMLRGSDPSRSTHMFDEAASIARSIEEPGDRHALADIAPIEPTIRHLPGEKRRRVSSLLAQVQDLASDEPRRAAELLYEAERTAWSIPDVEDIPKALAKVARAVAATDPTRSTLLFKEAEQLAQNIPETNAFVHTAAIFRAEAAKEIVSELAFVDPDWAERIARSIADEAFRSDALASVAQALVTSDVRRSVGLFGEAERAAHDLLDGFERTFALTHVACKLAELDVDWAERVTHLIPGDSDRAKALAKVVRVILSSDLNYAEQLARKIPLPSIQAQTLAEVARAWHEVSHVSQHM